MSVPLKLGGVEIPPHAGMPVITDGDLGAGSGDVRLSGGSLVSMTRWSKRAGSIGGQGLMPPGLGGLDFSQHLELLSTKVRTAGGTGLVHVLPFTPRPDVEPWALALVNGQWLPTPCGTVDRTVTVTPVTGAEQYQVWAMPVYLVKVVPPDETQDHAARTHSWSFRWEEA